MKRLSGRVALVTGVSRRVGIGFGIVRRLVAEDADVFAQGWTPELQKLVGGKQDAAGLLKAVQAEYEKELAR